MLDFSEPGKAAHALEALRTLSIREQLVGESVEMMAGGDRRGAIMASILGPVAQTYHWQEDYEPSLEDCVKVRKTPSWPRSWANFSLF